MSSHDVEEDSKSYDNIAKAIQHYKCLLVIQKSSSQSYRQYGWKQHEGCAFQVSFGHDCATMLLQRITRECEVIVGTTSNCLPTSVPVLPILLRAILYSLQYLYSFPPIVRLLLLNAMFASLINIIVHPTGNSIYL